MLKIYKSRSFLVILAMSACLPASAQAIKSGTLSDNPTSIAPVSTVAVEVDKALKSNDARHAIGVAKADELYRLKVLTSDLNFGSRGDVVSSPTPPYRSSVNNDFPREVIINTIVTQRETVPDQVASINRKNIELATLDPISTIGTVSTVGISSDKTSEEKRKADLQQEIAQNKAALDRIAASRK